MKFYQAKRSGPCGLCHVRYAAGDTITRWPGGRAHKQCALDSEYQPVPNNRAEALGLPEKACTGLAVLSDGRVLPYSKYLKTPQWKAVRLRRMAKDGYACFGCGAKKSLQVHHVNYRRMGQERMGDLRTLCQDCHAGITTKERAAGPQAHRPTNLAWLRG